MSPDFYKILRSNCGYDNPKKDYSTYCEENDIDGYTDDVLAAMKEVWNKAVNACADSIIDDQADLSGNSVESVYKNWIK